MNHRGLLFGVVATLGILSPTSAQDNPAVKPLNRDIPRHKEFLKIVAKGEADVIFIGDSITQGWEGAGKKVWTENFAPLKAVNLGIVEAGCHHDRHEQYGVALRRADRRRRQSDR